MDGITVLPLIEGRAPVLTGARSARHGDRSSSVARQYERRPADAANRRPPGAILDFDERRLQALLPELPSTAGPASWFHDAREAELPRVRARRMHFRELVLLCPVRLGESLIVTGVASRPGSR